MGLPATLNRATRLLPLAPAPTIALRRIAAKLRRHGWLAVFAALASGALAAQTLELDPNQSRRGLAPFARYVELPGSPEETLSQARALAPDAYAEIGKRFIDFGNRPDTIWLRFDLHSADAGQWMLSLNVRFMTGVTVYLGGGTERILLQQTATSTFDERPIPHRVLAVPFSLAAGERAELLIGYRSKGTTAMPVSIETPASYEQRYVQEDAINLAAYAAIAFLLAVTLLQAFTFREPTQLLYAFYLATTLAYILHTDGVTFQFLWPEHPGVNSYAAAPLGLVMSIAVLLFGRSFAETRKIAPAYDRTMLAVVGIAFLMCFGGLVADESQVKSAAFLIASLAATLCLGAGVLAYRRGRPAMRFFVIGWIGVVVGVVLTSVVNNLPALIPRPMMLAIPKLTILFDSLMFYTALADRSRQWRLERDTAMRREVEAVQVAQARSDQLAMASHDIRQPLTSLRLMLERLAGVASLAPLAASFRQSLDYLDRLAGEYSEDCPVPRGADDGKAAVASPAAPSEAFDVKTLLENVDLMFRDEAVGKGLEFRCRTRAARVSGDAMAAMRIVCNLVSNAIKYTREGRILVGCRKRSIHVTLIVADTGPGIPPDEIERVLQAHERGSMTEGIDGQGLGLGIASALASQQHYEIRCRSTPGRGTAFFVDMPGLSAS